jgi:hypothetical protein
MWGVQGLGLKKLFFGGQSFGNLDFGQLRGSIHPGYYFIQVVPN